LAPDLGPPVEYLVFEDTSPATMLKNELDGMNSMIPESVEKKSRGWVGRLKVR
jgi:hypothetical protein